MNGINVKDELASTSAGHGGNDALLNLGPVNRVEHKRKRYEEDSDSDDSIVEVVPDPVKIESIPCHEIESGSDEEAEPVSNGGVGSVRGTSNGSRTVHVKREETVQEFADWKAPGRCPPCNQMDGNDDHRLCDGCSHWLHFTCVPENLYNDVSVKGCFFCRGLRQNRPKADYPASRTSRKTTISAKPYRKKEIPHGDPLSFFWVVHKESKNYKVGDYVYVQRQGPAVLTSTANDEDEYETDTDTESDTELPTVPPERLRQLGPFLMVVRDTRDASAGTLFRRDKDLMQIDEIFIDGAGKHWVVGQLFITPEYMERLYGYKYFANEVCRISGKRPIQWVVSFERLMRRVCVTKPDVFRAKKILGIDTAHVFVMEFAHSIEFRNNRDKERAFNPLFENCKQEFAFKKLSFPRTVKREESFDEICSRFETWAPDTKKASVKLAEKGRSMRETRVKKLRKKIKSEIKSKKEEDPEVVIQRVIARQGGTPFVPVAIKAERNTR